MPAGALSGLRRRRIAEEASILGALLCADCIDPDALRVLQPVPVLSTPAATAAATFRLPAGWDTFADPGLYDDLVYVHRKLTRIYSEITRSCALGVSGPWKRPAIAPDRVDDISLPIGQVSRGALRHYLTALQPRLLDQRSPCRADRHRITHVYPLAGLAYAVTFAEHNGQLCAHVRTNVFSDLGGAGVTFIDGTIVKIRKGVGVLRADEIAARSAFQNDYLDRLRQHPLAGHALFPRT